MSAMLAAADLGIGAPTRASGTRNSRGGCWVAAADRFCALLITLGVPAIAH